MAIKNNISPKYSIRSLILTVLVAAVFATLVFAIKYKANSAIRGFEFQIGTVQDGRYLINKKEIKALAEQQLGFELSTANIDDLDLMGLENLLISDTRVKSAEVYLTKSNRIGIELEQRRPLYRVEGNGKIPYYIDKEGNRISVRKSIQKVRVPMVTGNVHPYKSGFETIKNHNLRKVHQFFKLTAQDTFIRSFIPQLDIDKKGEYVLIAKMSGKRILLGDMEDLEEKLKKLKIYCRQVGLDDFSELDLRFKDQVIGRT